MNKQDLVREIEEQNTKAIESVYKALEKFPWNDSMAYANWLAQSYYYVTHTSRLLALAAARLGPDQQLFHQRFVAHLAEEKGHEKLCLNDLKALGYKPSDFPELPETASMYHSVYFLIEHQNPCAILGYAMLLEGVSATKADDLLRSLNILYGKPATSFLRLHVEADKEHTQENRPILEACEVHQLEAVKKEIKMVESQYRTMLRGIRESLTKRQARPIVLRKAA